MHVTHDRSWGVVVPDAVHVQFDLLKMSMAMLKTCGGLWYCKNKDICALGWWSPPDARFKKH